jgi:hypothetical protein
MLAFLIAKVNGARDAQLEDFIPRWDAQAPDRDSVWTGFQKLIALADADDRNPHR